MVVVSERLRAFVGIEELEIASASYVINNNSIVNEAFLTIVDDNNVNIGTIINVKKNDGSTNVFTGQVHSISENGVLDVRLLSNGYELINTYVEKVYTNTSPEDIVKDIVNNFTTNLTYDEINSGVSNVVLDEYLAQGYAIDVIRKMMEALRWKTIITQTNEVIFNIQGSINNNKIFNNGNDFVVTNFETTDENIINRVRVEAGFDKPRTIETKSGTNTIFELSNKPESSVRVTVSGTEQNPDTYKVEPENNPPQVIFDSAVTDPVIEYTWNRKIIVEDLSETSKTQYGERFNKVEASYIITRSDALKFARSIIDEFSTETINVEGRIPFLDFSINVNERVRVIDSIRNKKVRLIINEITYNYDEGSTIIKLGQQDFDLINWQNGVQDRIKELERKFSSDDKKTFVRSFSSTLEIDLNTENLSPVIYDAQNSFILGHTTLGRMRETENIEVDCSDEFGTNTGTWKTDNTGLIDGNQFALNGFRLSYGVFDGTTNQRYIECTETINNIVSMVFYIKNFSSNTSLINLTSSANITIVNDEITTTGLNNVTILTTDIGDWKQVYITFDSINVNALLVGKVGSNYYTGHLDEFCLFDTTISTAELLEFRNKLFYSNHTKYGNCKLWYSFDNPLLGDRTEDITIAFFS